MNEEYLAMCEEALELKNDWKYSKGDRVFLTQNLYIKSNNLLSVVKSQGEVPMYVPGFYYLVGEFQQEFFKFCFPVPYQEQIQEKLLKLYGKPNTLLYEFFDFAVNYPKNTIDEVWLIMYYSVVHNKFWNGSEWRKENARTLRRN